MENKNLNKLFDDTANVKFGCVMFDLQNLEDGKAVPMPGSGWASVEGGPAFRIKGTGDLSNSVKWLTNLSQQTLWKTGAVKQPKLKHSSYLRTDVGQIMKELGLYPPKTPIANICETLSMLFNKIMKLAIEFYNLKSFNQKELYSEIKLEILGDDRNVSIHVDEALSRAYQDLVICEKSLSNDKSIFITLKKPRYFHAKSIIETSIPFWNGDWKFISSEDLPIGEENKINYLMGLDRPFLAKITINKFNISDDLNVDLSKLLNLGEAMGEGGKTKERNWVCQPELLYLSRFADLTIEAIFVADGFQKLNENIKLPYLGELSDFSYSLGILAENFWIGLANRSINPQTRSKTLVSPRACWLKAADRFMTMTSAMMLASAGFEIASYGYGGVTVSVEEDKIEKLIELAPHAGLLVPMNLIKN
jgi:hypothetical protein